MSTLIERLTDKEPKTQLAALLEAGDLTDLEGHDALMVAVVERLWDEHPGIRQASLDMLGRLSTFAGYIADRRTLNRALTLTSDERTGVRAEAAASLALLALQIRHTNRVPTLVKLSTDPEADVRSQALAALGDLGDASCIDALATCLGDADADVRFEAAFALASFKDPRCRPELEARLARTKRRLDACEGLRRLGDPAAVPALESLTSKWMLPWGDRLTIWATLHVLGLQDAGAEIVKCTTARRHEERTYALALIGSHKIDEGREMLESVAADPKDVLRETAIRALGELGSIASGDLLQRLTSDSELDLEVRADAMQALLTCDPAKGEACLAVTSPEVKAAVQLLIRRA